MKFMFSRRLTRAGRRLRNREHLPSIRRPISRIMWCSCWLLHRLVNHKMWQSIHADD